VKITMTVREANAKVPFKADLRSSTGSQVGLSQGETRSLAAERGLRLADRRGYEVINRQTIERQIVAPGPELLPTTEQLAALCRFQEASGWRWKQKLRSCWAAVCYPTASSDDARTLQSVRNQFGSRWLRKLQLTPPEPWFGIEPELARPAVWGARALYKTELIIERISHRGDTRALFAWLNATALPWLKQELAARRELLSYREGGFTLVASPKDYLYIGAWST
jgi:hypothetical protein